MAIGRFSTARWRSCHRSQIESATEVRRELPTWHEEILIDPQTSGGLLIALPAERVEETLAALRDAGVSDAVRIGSVEPTADVRLIFE